MQGRILYIQMISVLQLCSKYSTQLCCTMWHSLSASHCHNNFFSSASLVEGVDFIPLIFPDDAVELFGSDDGCSQRIYSSTGIPFGAATLRYVHVS